MYNIKTHIKLQLHIVCKSSNNVRHNISKTITTLQHFVTLHHFTQLYFTTLIDTSLPLTLHYPFIWLNPFTFPTALFNLTSLNQTQ